MWSGSPLKFEHPQHGQDNEFNNFQQMPPAAMPATPSQPPTHRRGQSLSALHNLPRTPNHQLRPPVYLQSPLATNPTGLMGVGDVFAPSPFNENMAYYSPVVSSPRTALDNLNEEFNNFDLSGGFGGPLNGSLFDSPLPSPRQGGFPFHQNPFTGPPESLLPSRTASPLHPSFTPISEHGSRMDSYLGTPQRSPTRESFRDFHISTPEPSPTHHSNPLKESLINARQPSPTREAILESLIRTPEPSPTRQSFSHPTPHGHNLLQNAPDLRPIQTPQGARSPSRSRNSPSPSRRMRAHQRTQSLASINSVVSLADGDMEQYRVESSVKPEEISALIGETDPSNPSSSQGTDNTKKYICKWIDQVTNKDGTSEEKTCAQFFERKENCKAHIQTHLDDRQYKCPYGFCGKLFVRSHDLRRHLRTHDVHKKWVCPCGRDFSRADALHRHQGRGNCIGAPPGTKRKEPAKRGRPPKKKDGVPGAGDTNAPPSITASDLSQPPQLNGVNNPSASFAPMGGRNDDNTDEIEMAGMEGLPRMDMDHIAPPDLIPSPSPTRDGELTSNSGGLAPSPLEDELSPSPMPSSSIGISENGDGENMLCGPPGDEWLEDLIFIDDNFVENGLV
ncbi:hypothetical protein VPNG_02210 [Cytospora leucostoma]|uniref:C2H2-type domain-containing protein n=1 Tax=Cytospora leucostoma TaxID=1230097 RepID=A0A423XHX3_9PEZI|nr:hypothetical protein VPNG_02210 [Cytospora leucostoma]